MKNAIKDQKNASITFGIVSVIVVLVAFAAGEVAMLMAYSAPLAVIITGKSGIGQFVKFMAYLFLAAIVSGLYMLSKAAGALSALAGQSRIDDELSVNPVLLIIGVLFCLACYFVAIERIFDASVSVRVLREKENREV